jgi:hypothetical protein
VPPSISPDRARREPVVDVPADRVVAVATEEEVSAPDPST